MKVYTVNQLAKISEVSVRTLHYYDTFGLLSPKRNPQNDYRMYDEHNLLTLQQILFFRELGFSLVDIKRIITSRNFDIRKALKDHKKMILVKKKKIDELLVTIDKTIKKLNKQMTIEDEELYEGFAKEEMEAWNKEAKERWANTPQYQESVKRYESLTKEEKLTMKKDGEALMEEMVASMGKGAQSDDVQALVQRHYDGLKFFYEPTLEMYRGLADMYVGYKDDTRYRAYFEKYHKDLPEFMRDAMYVFCERNQ